MKTQFLPKMLGTSALAALVVLVAYSPAMAQRGGKAEPNRIEFKRGTNSTTISDTVRGDEQAEYALGAKKGQRLVIKLTSVPAKSSVFQLLGPNNDTLGLEYDANYNYSGVLPTTGDYFISVRRPTESKGDELGLPFRPGEIYYLFVKKDAKTGKYQLPTPTSGWAGLRQTDVAATYRHSYHKALVPEDVYEKTMQAIFNSVKGQPYDTEYMISFMKQQLSMSVASLAQNDPETNKRFFLQHVALESFYYLRKGVDLSLLIPFTNSDDFHVQVSACRAVGVIDSPASRELLMKFMESKSNGFAKVMCVWGLKRLKAREMIPRMQAYLKSSNEEKTGFGGSIMDPRIGTFFPDSVQESVRSLLSEWGKPVPKQEDL